VGTSRPRGRVTRSAELTEEGQGFPPAQSPPDGAGSERTWLRSFGRRKGRKLSARQSALLVNGLKRLDLDFGQRLETRQVAQIFANPVHEIWLEIGFGSGEHLVWQAENNPHAGLIGAEPYVNGIVAALSAIEARQLDGRIRIYADDAVRLLDWLPPASLSRAFMLFPDPWPKTRHRARRLLSPFLLDKLSRVLSPGAEFRFASDIADYAEDVIAHMTAHPAFEIVRTFTPENRTCVPDWPITRYEAKANKAGRSSTFIVMRRKQDR
jgi:tRNA (guanine-N7-)-methyltransferase